MPQSRNAACMCGSGKKYKYCCGSLSEDKKSKLSINDALDLFERNDLTSSKRIAESLLAEDRDGKAHHLVAEIEKRNGNFILSKKHLEKAAGISPDNEKYLRELGDICALLNEFDCSISAYKGAIELRQDFCRLCTGWAGLRGGRGRLRRADRLAAVAGGPQAGAVDQRAVRHRGLHRRARGQ